MMLSGMKNEPSWPSKLRGLIPAFLTAVVEAQENITNDSGDKDLSAEKASASSYLNKALLRNLPGAVAFPIGAKEWVRVPGVALIRAKAVGPDLKSANLPTRHDTAFRSQDDFPEFGHLDDARLEFGYEFDAKSRTILRVHLIERDGDGVRASIEIALDGSAAEVIALPLVDVTTTVEVVPEVAAARRKKDVGTNDKTGAGA